MTNSFCLAAIHVKVNLFHFLSHWSTKEHVRKNLKKDDKRATVELWRAKVPLSTVRNQLKEFERTLRRVLASKGPTPSTRSSSGSLRQGDWGKSACPPGFKKSLFKRGEWPDTSTVYGLYTYQPTIDTFDTVYSSFHWICVWPAKTFGGHCIYIKLLPLPLEPERATHSTNQNKVKVKNRFTGQRVSKTNKWNYKSASVNIIHISKKIWISKV